MIFKLLTIFLELLLNNTYYFFFFLQVCAIYGLQLTKFLIKLWNNNKCVCILFIKYIVYNKYNLL